MEPRPWAAYEVDATVYETVLHSFAGGTDGSYPVSGLVAGPRGFFYGTTLKEGAETAGIVYAVNSGWRGVAVAYTLYRQGRRRRPRRSLDPRIPPETSTGRRRLAARAVPAVSAWCTSSISIGQRDGVAPIYGRSRWRQSRLESDPVMRRAICTGPLQRGAPGGVGVGVRAGARRAGRLCFTIFRGGAGGGGIHSAGVIRDAAGNLFGTAA